MPTGNEEKKFRFGIHINGKDHEYESFEEMFSDFVDEIVAQNQSNEAPEENDYDQMAQELFATYTAFKKAGFDREQAFELLLTIVGGNY